MKKMNLLFQRVIAWVIIIAIVFFAAYGFWSVVTPNWKVVDIDYEYVCSGDTLWNLCTPYCNEDMNLQEYIFYVEEYNSIDAGNLQPGQLIKMPIYEKEGFLG